MADAVTCSECGRRFQHGQAKAPPTCGRLACRMRHDYTDDDWAGKARMARARQAAELPLDELDEEALRRWP